MQKVVPYLTSGTPKICWGCGKPFVIRGGQAEAIVGPDGHLYCYRNGCDEDAFALHPVAPKHAS